MSSTTRDCLRCRGRMELGLVLDKGTHSVLTEQQWMEGPIEKSFWTGIQTKGRTRYTVTTYRCERCGYVESYASDNADQ